ncbi:uncharacterized protein [Prorops nasuta]|uniref:uncharacterized protein n=1 Tax=Prorops nasuta TaxID=863751 RepID=UPI0034CEDDB3
MDYPQFDYYYKLNYQWCYLVGMWPFQSRKNRLFRIAIVNFFIFTCLISQIINGVNTNYDIDILIDMSPCFTGMFGIMWAYFVALRQVTNLQNIWNMMKEDWCSERNEVEEAIKAKYADISRTITKLCTFAFLFVAPPYIFLTMTCTRIMDIIIPLNETRPNFYMFEFDYMLDKDKYFWFLASLVNINMVASITSVISAFSMWVTHMLHIFGMIEIIGYRLENAVPKKMEENSETRNLNEMYMHSLCLCIKRHLQALQFLSMFEKYSVPIFGFALVMSLFISVPTIYQLSNLNFYVKIYHRDIKYSIYFLMFYTSKNFKTRAVFQLITMLFFFFFVTLLGQFLTDLSNQLNEQCYAGSWYNRSVKVQKVVLMILSNSKKPFVITCFGLYALSLDLFRMVKPHIMHASFSYFMVFKSITCIKYIRSCTKHFCSTIRKNILDGDIGLILWKGKLKKVNCVKDTNLQTTRGAANQDYLEVTKRKLIESIIECIKNEMIGHILDVFTFLQRKCEIETINPRKPKKNRIV